MNTVLKDQDEAETRNKHSGIFSVPPDSLHLLLSSFPSTEEPFIFHVTFRQPVSREQPWKATINQTAEKQMRQRTLGVPCRGWWLIWLRWLCSHVKHVDSPPQLVLNSIQMNKKCRRWGWEITSSTSKVIKGPLLHPLTRPAQGFTHRTPGCQRPHTHGQLKDQGWWSCSPLAPAARASLSSLRRRRGFLSLSLSLSLASSLLLVRSVPSLICWKIYSEAFSCPPTQTYRLRKSGKPPSLPPSPWIGEFGGRKGEAVTDRTLPLLLLPVSIHSQFRASKVPDFTVVVYF